MLNNNAQEFDKLLKGYAGFKLRMARQVAGMAVAFFKDSFRNQGFTDNALVPWKQRIPGSPNDSGRAIETKSGTLKRGIRIKSASQNGAVVGVDSAIPYAEIQNFGGEIPITPQMRRFFWAMYYQTGGGKEGAGDTAQFYKNLALSKKQTITIPARKFIGDSKTLEKQITSYLTLELNKFLKVSG